MMSKKRSLVVGVSLACAIGLAGGNNPDALPSVGTLVVIVVALVVAIIAVNRYDQRFFDQVAKSL